MSSGRAGAQQWAHRLTLLGFRWLLCPSAAARISPLQCGTEQPGAAPGSFSESGLKTVLTSVADVGVQWAAHNRPLIADSGRHGRNKIAACQCCLAPVTRCLGIQTSHLRGGGLLALLAELQPWPPCFRAAASCEQAEVQRGCQQSALV